jgi:hypothetical protein
MCEAIRTIFIVNIDIYSLVIIFNLLLLLLLLLTIPLPSQQLSGYFSQLSCGELFCSMMMVKGRGVLNKENYAREEICWVTWRRLELWRTVRRGGDYSFRQSYIHVLHVQPKSYFIHRTPQGDNNEGITLDTLCSRFHFPTMDIAF